MTTFRYQVTVETPGPGSYQDGVWVDGVPVVTTVMGTVQPVRNDDLDKLPTGRQWGDVVRLYTDSAIPVLSENRNPSTIVWQGHRYEIIAHEAWQSGIISHHKYYCARQQSNQTSGPIV